MTMTGMTRLLLALGMLAGAGAAPAEVASAPTTAPAVRAITKCSDDVTLCFGQPGLVGKVLVKRGDAVKAGQTLAQQDDAFEQAQLEELKAEADDTVRVRHGEAQWAVKKVDLARFEEALKHNVATTMDVDHARLDAQVAEMSLELAKLERQQAGRKCNQMKIKVERMRLVSPVSGTVEEVLVQPGEAADGSTKAIRLVGVNPLWVEGRLPRAQGNGLCRPSPAKVQFRDGASAAGTLVFLSQAGDPASESLLFRVEIPNPTSRPAGENVTVTFGPAPRTRAIAPATAGEGPTTQPGLTKAQAQPKTDQAKE